VTVRLAKLLQAAPVAVTVRLLRACEPVLSCTQRFLLGCYGQGQGAVAKAKAPLLTEGVVTVHEYNEVASCK